MGGCLLRIFIADIADIDIHGDLEPTWVGLSLSVPGLCPSSEVRMTPVKTVSGRQSLLGDSWLRANN